MKIDITNIELYHDTLKKLSKWLEDETGLEFTETSGHRPGDPGVHGTVPCRGRDLRMRSASIGKSIVKFINMRWVYDPSRPAKKCAILHGEGSNLHIHLQVHPNTVLV